MVKQYSLIDAVIYHKRLRPREHAFRYKAFYLSLSLKNLESSPPLFLSYDRWNLLSFYQKDHGARDGSSLTEWIDKILKDYGLTIEGDIILVTLPRILGYVFNPVSFWFCHDREGQVKAVLYEVSNTFGEHHSYLSFHDDFRPITESDWLQTKKIFHVSPFMKVAGDYFFRFSLSESKLTAIVNHHDDEGLLLSTSLMGNNKDLSSWNCLKFFLFFPLVTFKIIMLIHFEAFRLWLKKVPFFTKPPKPEKEVTR